MINLQKGDLIHFSYCPQGYGEHYAYKGIGVIDAITNQEVSIAIFDSEKIVPHPFDIKETKITVLDKHSITKSLSTLIENYTDEFENNTNLSGGLVARKIYNLQKIQSLISERTDAGIKFLEEGINPPETGIYVAKGIYKNVCYTALSGVVAKPRLHETEITLLLEKFFPKGCDLIPGAIYHRKVDDIWGRGGCEFTEVVDDELLYQVGRDSLEKYSVVEIPNFAIHCILDSMNAKEYAFGPITIRGSQIELKKH